MHHDGGIDAYRERSQKVELGVDGGLDVDDVGRGALSIAQVAQRIADLLNKGDERTAWRWLLQFVDDLLGSSPAARAVLVRDAPTEFTGDRRYDAALAALVEHLCANCDVPYPLWTNDPRCFAEPWWFVAGLPGYRAAALRDSPISFKRHGVFVTKGALTVADLLGSEQILAAFDELATAGVTSCPRRTVRCRRSCYRPRLCIGTQDP